MSHDPITAFVSRAGLKLDHALRAFAIEVTGIVCADLGCNAGGFTDCLLQRGAARVYAVDTGYGMLDWKLRKHAQVVVMERTNAMHVDLPEPIDLIVVDVAWTRQKNILPAVARLLSPTGSAVVLIKPHYEAPKALLRHGVLPLEHLPAIMQQVRSDIAVAGFECLGETPSPIIGQKGNHEVLIWLRPVPMSR